MPAVFLLFLSAIFLSAKDSPSADEEIVLPAYTVNAVRAERSLESLPSSISVVDQTTIQEGTLQITLDEPLQNIPGVFILNPFNFAQDTRIAIRGFGARADFGIRGIRLFVDGIPATTPDGQGEVDGLDLGSAERIEILRGPSSALYGTAAGGVILIETESGPPIPIAETRLTVGSYGFFQTQAKAGGQWDNLNALANLSYMEYDGYRNHSRTRGSRFNSKVEYEIKPNSELTLIANAIDLPQQDDPGGLTLAEAEDNPRQARERNLLFDSGEEVSQERIGAKWSYLFDESKELIIRGYYTHRDFANRLPFENGGQVTFERHYPGAGFLFREEEGDFRWRTGLDFDYQDDRRRNYDNVAGVRGPLVLDQKERVSSLGIFLAPEVAISDTLTGSAALRYDRVHFDVQDEFSADGDDSGSETFHQWSPMVGINWGQSEALNLFANFTQSFETPTTTELDNPDGGGFNENLDPQIANSFEVGAKGSISGSPVPIRYELTLFTIDIEDSLVPFEEADTPGREFYRNAGSSQRTGVEAFAEAFLFPDFSVALSYTWSDFRYDSYEADGEEFSGNEIPGIPENFGSIVLQYRKPSGFFVRWITRVVGSFYADDGNTTRIDSYTTSDLRLGMDQPFGNWTVSPFIGINNIFDESYYGNIRINAFGGRYYEPAPERNYYGGIRVTYSFE